LIGQPVHPIELVERVVEHAHRGRFSTIGKAGRVEPRRRRPAEWRVSRPRLDRLLGAATRRSRAGIDGSARKHLEHHLDGGGVRASAEERRPDQCHFDGGCLPSARTPSETTSRRAAARLWSSSPSSGAGAGHVREAFGPLPRGAETPKDVPPLYGWSFPTGFELKEDIPAGRSGIGRGAAPPADAADATAVEVMLEVLAGGSVDPLHEIVVSRAQEGDRGGGRDTLLPPGGGVVFYSASLPYRRKTTAMRVLDDALHELDRMDWLTDQTLRRENAGFSKTKPRRRLRGERAQEIGQSAGGWGIRAARSTGRPGSTPSRKTRWRPRGPSTFAMRRRFAFTSSRNTCRPTSDVRMVVPALLLAAVATWTIDTGTEGALVEDHRADRRCDGRVSRRHVVAVGAGARRQRRLTFQDDDPERSLRKRRMPSRDDRPSCGGSIRGPQAALLESRPRSVSRSVKDVLANASYDRHELKRTHRESRILWRGYETDVSVRIAQAAARQLFASDDPRRLPYEKPQRVENRRRQARRGARSEVRWPGRVIGFAGDLNDAEAKRAPAVFCPPPSRRYPSDVAPRLGPFTPRPRARKTSTSKSAD